MVVSLRTPFENPPPSSEESHTFLTLVPVLGLVGMNKQNNLSPVEGACCWLWMDGIGRRAYRGHTVNSDDP